MNWNNKNFERMILEEIGSGSDSGDSSSSSEGEVKRRTQKDIMSASIYVEGEDGVQVPISTLSLPSMNSPRPTSPSRSPLTPLQPKPAGRETRSMPSSRSPSPSLQWYEPLPGPRRSRSPLRQPRPAGLEYRALSMPPSTPEHPPTPSLQPNEPLPDSSWGEPLWSELWSPVLMVEAELASATVVTTTAEVTAVAMTASPMMTEQVEVLGDSHLNIEEPHGVERVAVRRRGRGRAYRGTRGRGARGARGASRGGRFAAIHAPAGERGWRRGEPPIQICALDSDIPPRLEAIIESVSNQTSSRQGPEMECEGLIFGGDRSAVHFDWMPMGTFQSSQEPFLPETTGPIRNFSNAYEAFRNFWDDDIMQHIVVETNRYAVEISLHSPRFASDWVDTNADEILVLFAFWMMLGVIRMPTIKSCFSTHNLLQTKVFSTLLTEHRYWLLSRALHFVDNSTRTSESSKLFSLGPLAEHLNSKFQCSYTPGQNISLDESLTLWKGNLSFRQYIRTKAAKFGIKTFELCDAANGYLWSFKVYTGKDTSSSPGLPKSTEVVINLIRPLLHRGYRLFMDNWFNSPILARYLKRNKTDCIGTLRRNRRNVAPLIQHATIPEGHFMARHAGDVVVMLYQDKKPICTISTYHGIDVEQIPAKPGRSVQYKPSVIADYNRGMGGVDKKDQMLEPYLIERKRSVKWYKKLFKRLLNVSIHNSRVLVGKSPDQTTSLAFRLELVNSIMERHLSQVPTSRRRQVPNINPNPVGVNRFSGQHFIVRSDYKGEQRTAGKSQTSLGRQDCVSCAIKGERHRTVYICNICIKPFCIGQCFIDYHTLPPGVP